MIRSSDEIQKLISAALKIRKNSYAPYSHYAVGAALLTHDRKIYTGVNAENSSYPVGICAERSAFAAALSDGKRSFRMIAIAGGKAGEQPEDYCMPCGMCRQFMSEFCGENFVILSVRSEDDFKSLKLKELLPYAFGFDLLDGE